MVGGSPFEPQANTKPHLKGTVALPEVPEWLPDAGLADLVEQHRDRCICTGCSAWNGRTRMERFEPKSGTKTIILHRISGKGSV